jgi:hypothetical protein
MNGLGRRYGSFVKEIAGRARLLSFRRQVKGGGAWGLIGKLRGRERQDARFAPTIPRKPIRHKQFATGHTLNSCGLSRQYNVLTP